MSQATCESSLALFIKNNKSIMKFRDYDNYEIYEDGSIFSYLTNKFLKPKMNSNGYKQVGLIDNEGKRKMYLVHRIVFEVFSGKPIPQGMQCNHISEDKTDNRFCNINLMTPKENSNWGTRNSRISKANTNNQKLSKALTNNPKKSKPVGAYKNDELIMTFPSTKEAGRNDFNHKHISECCIGKRKTHRGYEWRYI